MLLMFQGPENNRFSIPSTYRIHLIVLLFSIVLIQLLFLLLFILSYHHLPSLFPIGVGFQSFFLCDRRANEQSDRLVVSDHRRPWTPATPEASQVRCRPFKGFGPPVTSLTPRHGGISVCNRWSPIHGPISANVAYPISSHI